MLNPSRPYESLPVVKLGSKAQFVAEYQQRVAGPVDIVELDHLTVSGDFSFDKGVILRVCFGF